MSKVQPEESYEFEDIVNKYKPLIRNLVTITLKKNYSHTSIEWDDLYQEALLGVYKALESYDIEKGVYFSHYLGHVIKNRLSMYVRDFLPHHFKKNKSASFDRGKPVYDRIAINVGSLEAYTSENVL